MAFTGSGLKPKAVRRPRLLLPWPGIARQNPRHRMKFDAGKPGQWWVGAFLCAATLLAYWPVAHHGFLSYDDPHYVTHNPQVSGGLTWAGVQWAFTAMHASNWHPLTWLSHMLDCEWFGLNPRAHHLMNLGWHTANVLLLFAWLRELTGSLWRSGFIAAIFGLHPMHVESVAWIAERKDVLSTFFGLLALLAYTRYIRAGNRFETGTELSPGSRLRAGWNWYLLTLLAFALSLLSKPMLVTLPCVLLLLDYWPFQRFAWEFSGVNATRFFRLGVEKIPFFLLTATSGVLTFLAQRQGGAVATTLDIGFDTRLENSVLAFGWYVWRFLWPVDQAIIYPLQPNRPEWQLGAAAALILALTAVALWQAKIRPWLLVGWFWFLGVLVPVIGLVQVGMQSYADRYTYLPYVGLSLMAIWSTTALAQRRPGWIKPGGVIALTFLGLSLAATRHYLAFWKDDETLYRRALAVTENNYIAMSNLGYTLSQRGEYEAAIGLCENAARLCPGLGDAYSTLGFCHLQLKQPELAVTAYQQAMLYLKPRPGLRQNLGNALYLLGRYEEALNAYESSLKLKPEDAQTLANCGDALAALGRKEEASASYEKALVIPSVGASVCRQVAEQLLALGQRRQAWAAWEQALVASPTELKPHLALAGLAQEDHDFARAETHWRAFLAGHPDHAEARLYLGIALAEQGQLPAAMEAITLALKQSPESAMAHYWHAMLLARQGDVAAAIAGYRESLRLAPDQPEAMNNLAWLLVSVPDAALRNGPEAVRLARRACELTQEESATLLGTLAAAQAEAGDFPGAIATAKKAQTRALQDQQPEVAAKNGELLRLYKAGKTIREEVATPNP